MERRRFLTGVGVAALLPVAGGATAKDQSLGDGTAAGQAPDLSAALQKLRATIPSHFDREYVNNAVVPFFLGSIFADERPILPMIDLPLTKQDAIPWDFWGMLGHPHRGRGHRVSLRSAVQVHRQHRPADVRGR